MLELAEHLARAHRELGLIALPDVDLQLVAGLVDKPDFVVYAAVRVPKLPTRLMLPPDLVIEVLSPGSRGKGLVTSLNDYHRFGVGECWNIDPVDGAGRVCRRGPRAFSPVADSGDCLARESIPGLVPDVRLVGSAASRPERSSSTFPRQSTDGGRSGDHRLCTDTKGTR